MPFKCPEQKKEYNKLRQHNIRSQKKQNRDTYIFYKISCKNFIYVGSTLDFNIRKQSHYQASLCVNKTTKIYEIIRKNGGWDNWKMEIIDTKLCLNKHYALIIEQHYIDELNANLNTNNTFIKQSITIPATFCFLKWKTKLTIVLTQLIKIFVPKNYFYEIRRFELLFDTIRMRYLLSKKTNFNIWMNKHLNILDEIKLIYLYKTSI
jgi:hypothetical protein